MASLPRPAAVVECPDCGGPVCPDGWGAKAGPDGAIACFCIDCAAKRMQTTVDTLKTMLPGCGGVNPCLHHQVGQGPCPLDLA